MLRFVLLAALASLAVARPGGYTLLGGVYTPDNAAHLDYMDAARHAGENRDDDVLRICDGFSRNASSSFIVVRRNEGKKVNLEKEGCLFSLKVVLQWFPLLAIWKRVEVLKSKTN